MKLDILFPLLFLITGCYSQWPADLLHKCNKDDEDVLCETDLECRPDSVDNWDCASASQTQSAYCAKNAQDCLCVSLDATKNCVKSGYLCDQYSESPNTWKGWTGMLDPTCVTVTAPHKCLESNGVVKTRDFTECINETTGHCVLLGDTNCINNETLMTCVPIESTFPIKRNRSWNGLCKYDLDGSWCYNTTTTLKESTSKILCLNEETGNCVVIGPESIDFGIKTPLDFTCVDLTPANKCLDESAQLVVTMSDDGLCKGGVSTNIAACHTISNTTNYAKHSISHQCIQTSDVQGAPPIGCRVWDGTKCIECDSSSELQSYGLKCEIGGPKNTTNNSFAFRYNIFSFVLIGAITLNLF